MEVNEAGMGGWQAAEEYGGPDHDGRGRKPAMDNRTAQLSKERAIDMATITSPLPSDAKKVVGECLQGALIDLIDLSLVAKQAHWNLLGPHFRSLHLQLDDIVDISRKHMDVVAERAVAIGVNPDGRSATVARDSSLHQPDYGYIQDTKVVEMFTDLLDGVVKRMRDRVTQTEEPDPGTQDLLIEAAQDLEQQHWMIQAQR
jgi:starvation-inducible DNA-binding protein